MLFKSRSGPDDMAAVSHICCWRHHANVHNFPCRQFPIKGFCAEHMRRNICNSLCCFWNNATTALRQPYVNLRLALHLFSAIVLINVHAA